MLSILTSRELFLIVFGTVTYIALFVVAVQNSRRKIAAMQERLDRAHAMQEQYDIEGGRQKIAELEQNGKEILASLPEGFWNGVKTPSVKSPTRA